MQRGAPEPIGEHDPEGRDPGLPGPELNELRADLLKAFQGLPKRARAIAASIAAGRKPSRKSLESLRADLAERGRLGILAGHL
jgi:hypothetical protein